MALPNNILQQVQTYQMSGLAYLQNYGVGISISNKKFQNFQDMAGNLGTSVTFDIPPQLSTVRSLVATFQSAKQKVQTLTVNQEVSASLAFNAEQFIYNVRDYMDQWGRAAIAEIGAVIEQDVLKNAETNTYRFYGDGSTAINSFGQLANMLANYRNIGAPREALQIILPDTAVPNIVNSGLNQFVMDRNEEMANSWMIGDWNGAKWYQSNLLPTHTAGTVGNSAQTLTVVSTNDPTGANITQITFSGATNSDTNAIKANDAFQFKDSVSGQTNVRFLTYYGHIASSQPCQFRATADVAADGSGNVVVNIDPPLTAIANSDQNINTNIVAGMQVTALPSHRCGFIVGASALYLAIPRLPEEVPYPTANKSDPDTGASIRMYYGSRFGQNERGIIHDAIYGTTAVSRYVMRIAFPL